MKQKTKITYPKIKVKVERKHIDKGRFGEEKFCPISLALKEQTDGKRISTHYGFVRMNGQEYMLPNAAEKFVEKFDKGDMMTVKNAKTHRSKLKPFKFELVLEPM